MPKVGNKKFPYTKAGKAAAAKAEKEMPMKMGVPMKKKMTKMMGKKGK